MFMSVLHFISFKKCRSEEAGGEPLFVIHAIIRPWIICMDPDNAKVFIINTISLQL